MPKRNWVLSSIMAAVLYGWLYVFHDHPLLLHWGGVVIFPLLGAGMSSIAMFRAYLSAKDKDRLFWLFLCIGTWLFVAAQIAWMADLLQPGYTAPYPNADDYLWLAQYAFFLVALFFRLTKGYDGGRVSPIFNTVIFMAIATTLCIHFLIDPVLRKEFDSTAGLVTSISFPLFDLGFLFAVVRLFQTSPYGTQRKVISILAVGFTIQIVSDVLHTYLQSIDQYQPGGFVDPLWLIPLLLMGIAADCSHVQSEVDKARNDMQSPIMYGGQLIPYVSVFGLFLLVILNGQMKPLGPLEVGLLVVMLLVIARQLFILGENRKLLEKVKEKHEELARSEERYRHVVEISPNAICIEREGNILYVNQAGLDLLGLPSAHTIVGKSIKEFTTDHDREKIRLQYERTRAAGEAAKSLEIMLQRPDGRSVCVEASFVEISYNGEKAFLCVGQDITGRKEAEAKVIQLAYYDALTELPNRAMFHEHLQGRIDDMRSTDDRLAIFFIDLDRFKFINDTMGHSFGDVFLKQVAGRLSRLIGQDGTVYRLGGDEFCIIAGHVGQAEATRIAGRIVGGFVPPFHLDGSELFTTPSIGISLYPADGEDKDTLIRLADIAMYNAKKRGGNGYRFYESDLDDENAGRLNVENALRRALEQNELVVHYQPKVNLVTGELIGLEALVRWQHPEQGMVPPGLFIPIAEETGLIVAIDRWVLFEACSKMKKWNEAGHPAIGMAVNLSARQFKEKDLVRNVAEALRETGLEAQYLEIEVTESVMQNVKESSALLHELKRLGIRISVDDFGTGYSSLSYLKHLPIDCLKVDKSFVDDITVSLKDEAIIKTIVDMGQHLELSVIAEGIESERQLRALIEHGCYVGQGYYFSKPLPADQAERLFGTCLVGKH